MIDRREFARLVVHRFRGRFSVELGLDVDQRPGDVERWFLAATLFGTRISTAIAMRTYRTLAAGGVCTVPDAGKRSWDDLVVMLDEGGYARYDFRTATRLQHLATVLDAAALFNAAVDVAPSPTAGLCIRAGWLTLRRLADYFRIPYPVDLHRSVPISITREEFDLVIQRLERSGVPIVANRDAAWNDFVGWRVNYDAIIEAFYDRFTCPRTDWHTASVQPLFGPSNQRGQ